MNKFSSFLSVLLCLESCLVATNPPEDTLYSTLYCTDVNSALDLLSFLCNVYFFCLVPFRNMSVFTFYNFTLMSPDNEFIFILIYTNLLLCENFGPIFSSSITSLPSFPPPPLEFLLHTGIGLVYLLCSLCFLNYIFCLSCVALWMNFSVHCINSLMMYFTAPTLES